MSRPSQLMTSLQLLPYSGVKWRQHDSCFSIISDLAIMRGGGIRPLNHLHKVWHQEWAGLIDKYMINSHIYIHLFWDRNPERIIWYLHFLPAEESLALGAVTASPGRGARAAGSPVCPDGKTIKERVIVILMQSLLPLPGFSQVQGVPKITH